jgi:hypothetical protein
MMKNSLRVALGGSTAVLALALLASPAAAAPSGLDAAKQVATARIDGRLATLKALTTAVGAAKHLTAAHRTTLTTLLQGDQSGLTALRTKVSGETTVAGVRTDAQRMVDDYRIYLLVGPKVRLSVAADIETAAVAQLKTTADTLAAAIATAKQNGKDTTRAEADLADLRAQTDAAGTAIAGQADTLLAIAPGPDAAAIQGKVKPVREAVRTGRTDLRKALADAKAIRAALA